MSKKILVLDDEELITKSLLKLLSKEGYKVAIARSGQEALRMVEENIFDLVISDVRMPELNGVETVQQIRTYLRKANKKPVPEILITGYADKDKYETAMDLKVADYIYKPFDREVFLKVVKRIIG